MLSVIPSSNCFLIFFVTTLAPRIVNNTDQIKSEANALTNSELLYNNFNTSKLLYPNSL